MKRVALLRFLHDESRLRAHFDSAGLDGSRPLPALLEELARLFRAEQRRLESTPLDQTGEAQAALAEVRQRLASKTKRELKVLAEGVGVHVRTLYRIRAGQSSVYRTTLKRLTRELGIEFEEVAYAPPELTDVDEEVAAAALRWATAEWVREQNAKLLAGEPPTMLALCELSLPGDGDSRRGPLQHLSPENVQEWRSQHPERWPEPPYSLRRVRVWKHRAARART